MKPSLLIVVAAAVVPARMRAQVPEHFEYVQYLGGSSTNLKSGRRGWVVLTDSAVEFHLCWSNDCGAKEKGTYSRPEAALVIPYRRITEASNATERHGASVGQRAILGGLAAERRDELVTIAFDGDNTADAPVFMTQEHESAQLIAKIKFHLRKIGLIPASAPIVRDSVP